VGEVAKKVGNILIPKPSRDIDEAGWRSTDLEILYNELFVPIGEIECRDRLLDAFKESEYGIALVFEVEERDGVVVYGDKSPTTPDRH